jgi:hypothetical protein
MEIRRSGTQASAKGPSDYFTGAVRIDPLFDAPGPARTLGVSVTFEPGARTAWHTHPLGQTLIVTSGCGLVQCRRRNGFLDNAMKPQQTSEFDMKMTVDARPAIPAMEPSRDARSPRCWFTASARSTRCERRSRSSQRPVRRPSTSTRCSLPSMRIRQVRSTPCMTRRICRSWTSRNESVTI